MPVSTSAPTFHSEKESLAVETEKHSGQKYLYIPDTMETWPWPRNIHPYYEVVTTEADVWFKSFQLLTPEAQYAFDKCDFGRLASLVYPDASREGLRIGVDLMIVLFLVDEYTDHKHAPVVSEIIDVVIDVLHHPEKVRPEGEMVLGEMTRQFWSQARKVATLEAANHFVQTCTAYLLSVVGQAEDRDSQRIHTTDTYFECRRHNSGVVPCFLVGELHLALPDKAYHHPILAELRWLATDLVLLDNDLASYNKEHATGDIQYNIITVVMHQYSCDFDSAMQWAVKYHKEVQERFMAARKNVPSWGPEVDAQVQEYIMHLANWPRGNHCWCFESGRYFGTNGREYQKTRLVPLLPKDSRNLNLRRDGINIPLVEGLEESRAGESDAIADV